MLKDWGIRPLLAVVESNSGSTLAWHSELDSPCRGRRLRASVLRSEELAKNDVGGVACGEKDTYIYIYIRL